MIEDPGGGIKRNGGVERPGDRPERVSRDITFITGDKFCRPRTSGNVDGRPVDELTLVGRVANVAVGRLCDERSIGELPR
tara:strand:+ start:1154 stop:1393 length:240 start_codon:yes stop_codon:yes gene_type:complete